MREKIEKDGILYAEIIWKDFSPSKTTFISDPERSFQFGVIAHESGYEEPAHVHKKISRTISDLQQMIVVLEGKLKISFFDSKTQHLFKEIILNPEDSICLVHGPHSITALEKIKCISVKQGPFLGDTNDKILFTQG